MLSDRAATLDLPENLPSALLAEHQEALSFIDRHRLHGKGIGFVEAHLLASVALMPGTTPWTRDGRLNATAALLRCAYSPAAPH